MGKIKTVELTKAQRAVLEKGYRTGASHAFRTRCRMILLKSERRAAAEIAALLGCCEVAVNNWLKRYEAEGIEGLRTKPGRGWNRSLMPQQICSRSKQPFKPTASGSAWRRLSWRSSWARASARGRLRGI